MPLHLQQFLRALTHYNPPPAQPASTFRSAIFQIDLFPDSRGYVLFNLSCYDKESGRFHKGIELRERFTCEYLADLITVCVEAIKWIEEHCEHVSHEGQHLYFKFKEAL